MTDEMKLSQDEIDALLKGEMTTPAGGDDSTLTDLEKDALGEISNISFGSAATSLSLLLQQRVEITTPMVKILRASEVPDHHRKPYVIVTVEYTQGLSGTNALAIELNDAKTIADLMMGGDGTNVAGDLNELHLSAVAEAMNQMMGGAATAMSTMFGIPINISPPRVKIVDLSVGDLLDLGTDWIVATVFRLTVGELIDSTLMQLVPVEFAREEVRLLMEKSQSPRKSSEPVQPSVANSHGEADSPVGAGVGHGGPATAPVTGAGDQVSQPATQPAAPVAAASGVSSGGTAAPPPFAVHKPEFQEFQEFADSSKVPRNLSLLFDVNLDITVELGRTRKSIKDILDLTTGSIIELDKLAGEPVDILVNGKRIAIGEVVVIDENFGVRVTDIISPIDRVRNLQ